MVEKEGVKIPPMPDDFMPKQKYPQGRKIQPGDNDLRKLQRDLQRRMYWERKWKLHYLQQLLKEM